MTVSFSHRLSLMSEDAVYKTLVYSLSSQIRRDAVAKNMKAYAVEICAFYQAVK